LKILRRRLHYERAQEKTKRCCHAGHASHLINAPLFVVAVVNFRKNRCLQSGKHRERPFHGK
jgi:hypothetical protein